MKEVFSLLSKQIVYKNSSILSLTPFLDENNYSLFWWTLKHADILTISKKKIVLSKDHCLSRLLIKEVHEQNAHVGREYTLLLLRKHF